MSYFKKLSATKTRGHVEGSNVSEKIQGAETELEVFETQIQIWLGKQTSSSIPRRPYIYSA